MTTTAATAAAVTEAVIAAGRNFGDDADLLALCVVRLTDMIIKRVWHDGFPHRPTCQRADCAMYAYHRWIARDGSHVGSIASWRRHVAFGHPPPNPGRSGFERLHRIRQLCSGQPLLEVQPDLRLAWGSLYRFAEQQGLDPAAVRASVRTHMAHALACLLET